MKKLKRKASVVVAVALMCLGVIVTRAVWEGRSALSEGDEAAARGEHDDAIRWWRRAARWYVPGSGHVAAAYDRLQKLASAAEASGDSTTALAAWRAVRRSVLATRSVYTPFADRLEEANQHIAALMSASDAMAGADADERSTLHLTLLERELGPSVAWSLVALFGLVLWVGGGFLFAVRGVGRDDRLRPRPALLSAAVIAAGLLVWMLGLYSA